MNRGFAGGRAWTWWGGGRGDLQRGGGQEYRRRHGLARESEGLRPRREGGALPGWAETGSRGLVRWLRAHPEIGAPACEGLRALEPDVVLPALNAASELSLGEVDAETIVAFAKVVFAHPAEEPAFVGFRAGIDAWMQAR